MLRDSGHIQESDAEYVNKKHRRRGDPRLNRSILSKMPSLRQNNLSRLNTIIPPKSCRA